MESMYSTRSVRFGEKPSILRQLFFPSAMTVGNPLRMIENGKVVCDRAGGTRKGDPPSPPSPPFPLPRFAHTENRNMQSITSVPPRIFDPSAVHV